MWGERPILQISLCPEHAESLSDFTEKIVKEIVDSNDYKLDNCTDKEGK